MLNAAELLKTNDSLIIGPRPSIQKIIICS